MLSARSVWNLKDRNWNWLWLQNAHPNQSFRVLGWFKRGPRSGKDKNDSVIFRLIIILYRVSKKNRRSDNQAPKSAQLINLCMSAPPLSCSERLETNISLDLWFMYRCIMNLLVCSCLPMIAITDDQIYEYITRTYVRVSDLRNAITIKDHSWNRWFLFLRL